MSMHDVAQKTALDTATKKQKPLLELRVIHRFEIDREDECAEMLAVTDGEVLNIDRLKNYIAAEEDPVLSDMLCMVQKTASCWTLEQQSRTASCVVNDVALRYGEAAKIRRGDRIELGMLCMIVVNDAVSDAEHMFVLADLADEEKNPLSADPFSHLPRFRADMNSDAQTFYDDSPEKQDVIAKLASEYALAIADPASLQLQYAAAGAAHSATRSMPTAAELAQKNPVHFSLEDVVSGQLSIDQILTRIGTNNTSWDQAATSDDVLMLFADGIPRREQSHLPHLTRREHHVISPDSHLFLKHAARIDNASASSDDHHFDHDK